MVAAVVGSVVVPTGAATMVEDKAVDSAVVLVVADSVAIPMEVVDTIPTETTEEVDMVSELRTYGAEMEMIEKLVFILIVTA